jgi:hypothetical protein
MEPKVIQNFLKLFLSITLFVQITNSVPLSWQSNSCASSCSSDPFLIRYDSGHTYYYSFETSSHLSLEDSDENASPFVITGQLQVSSYGTCELGLQLSEVQINGLNAQQQFSFKQALEANPLMFGFDDGRIVGVCPSLDDQDYVVDIKKSIISALQMSARSTTSKSIVMESDILGDCETEYTPESRYYSSIVIQKHKSLNACSRRQQSVIGLFPRAFGVNEVLSRQTAPLLNATLVCTQTLDADIIKAVTCEETQTPYVWLKQQSTPSVVSSLRIRFLKQSSGLSARRLATDSFSRHVLQMSEPKKKINWYSQHYEESDVTTLFRSLCTQYEASEAGKGGGAKYIQRHFPELVQALQQINDVNAFKRIDTAIHDKQLCSSSNQVIHDLWLDALSLSATEPGMHILVNALNSNEISSAKAAYLFSLLAFSPEPSVGAVRALLPLLENKSSPRHVILGISSFVRNLREKEPQASDEVLGRATEALIARVQSQARAAVPIDAIASLKALENVLNRYSAQSRAQSVLLELAQDSGLDNGVRSAAISALAHFKADASAWNDVIERVISDTRASLELRINAYKSAVISGLNANQLKRILDGVKSEQNEQFSNYVRTHQKSIRESSDPFKRDLLPRDAPVFPNPEHGSIFDFGQSRNIEYSYLNDKLNSGFVLESDIVYPQSSQTQSRIPIPRSVSFNTSIPFFGKQLQLIEITFRQNGFDSVIENAMKIDSKGNYFKIISEIFESFSEQKSHQSANKYNIFKTNQNSNQNFAQIYVKFDGKSILAFDLLNDFDKFEHIFEQIRRQLEQRVQFDRAIALVLSDARVRIPTLTGIPVEINVNASFAAALKANVQMNDHLLDVVLRPSISGQMAAGIGLSLPSAQRGLTYVGEAWSAPVIDFKVDTRDNRALHVKVNVPEQKQSIFGFKAKQCVDNWKTGETDDPNPRVTFPQIKGCSQTLSKALGLQLCMKLDYPKPLLSPYGVFEADITIDKSDVSLKSYDFSIEMPKQSNDEMRVWRAAFNTPNSQVNREMALEFLLNTPPQGKQEARVSLKSPFKNIAASVALKNDEKERALQIEVVHDAEKLLLVDAGVAQQSRGQKIEFRPRVKLQVYGQREPVVLQGSVSVSRGRKNSIQISLEGPEAGKQFLKGQFVREGEKRSNDWRISSDIALQMPEMVEMRVAGVLDKAVKHVSTDLTFEYKIGKSMKKRETLKLSAKAQNLTQTSLKKMSAFAEMTSSQFPNRLNAQIAYNLLSKSNEHMENELSISWSQQLKNKLRVLQVMKVLSDNKVENTLNIQLTPLKVDYEMRANVDKANSKPYQYSLELIGKDKNGNKANDVRASVEYRHVSQSPLHVALQMNAKTGSGYDLSYSDELKEIARGEFKGRTSVKWDKDKEASLDYLYKTKSDPRAGVTHHELETELMTPHKSPFPMKHSGLLRMTRDGFEVKSRAHANGRQVYALESVGSYSNPQQNSRFALDVTSVGRGRLEFNPYSVPRVASLDVALPHYSDFEHKSNFELQPHASFSLNSQTKRAQQNLFALDSHFARDSPSRVVITSQPLDARVNYHPITRTFEVDARSPTNDWSHVSTVIANPVSRVMSLKSTTTRNSSPLIEIESEFAPKHKSFMNVNVPRVGALAFDANLTPRAQKNANLVIRSVSGAEHKSKLLFGKSGTKFVSTSIDQKRTPLLSIDYNHDPEDSRHTLSVDTHAMESRLDAQLAPYSDDNSVKFALKSGAHAPHHYSHETEVKLNPNAILVTSQTQNRNKNIAKIDATLARDYTQQPSNVHVNVLNTRSQFALNPRQSAKFEFNNPSIVEHVSQLEYQPHESSYSFVSRSRTPNSDMYNVNALYSRDSKTLATQLPAFDASLRFVPQTNSAKFAFNGKRANNAYNHVTELEFSPQQYAMKSRTDRQYNGQNVLSLDGLLANKKSFAVKYLDGPHASEAKLMYVKANDGRAMNVFGRHQQYTHSSDAEWDDKSLRIKSRTDYEPNKQNVHKVDASLAFNPYVTGSHASFVSPKIYAGLNHSPVDRNAKFEFRTQALEHHTSLAHNARAQEWQLKSMTVNADNKQRLFELNSALAPKRVNFALESPGLVNSKLVLENLNGKSAQFELNAHRIPHVLSGLVPAESLAHKTDVSLSPENAFLLNSQTSLDARVFAKLNARLNQPNNLVSVETPSFVARSQYQNIASPRVELEYRSKYSRGRHVLASIAGGIGSGNGVEVDIAFDKANDPNNQLVLTFSIEQNRNGNSLFTSSEVASDLVAMTINYRQNELKLLSEMNSRSFLTGPHTLTLSWQPQSGDAVQLTASHNWNFRDKQLTCESTYSVGGVLQFSSKFEAKATANVYRAHVITSSPNDNAFDYDFGVEARVVNENELNANIWAKNGASKTANAKLELTRDSYQGIYNGQLTLQVNGVDERRVTFTANRNERLIEADVYASNAKQLALMARASQQAISFNLLSNVARIPSLKALASLDVDKRSLVVTLEKNAIRVFDLSAKYTGSYYYNDLNADFRITYPQFAISANAKRLSGHMSAGTEVVVNDKTVFSAQFSAQNQRNSANNWIAKGHIVANEAELARASLEQTFGSNALQYALRASSQYAREFSPLSVLIAKKSQSRDRQYSIEICAKGDASQCLRSQIDFQLADTRYRSNIQKLVIKVSKPETDVSFEYALNAEQKLNEGSHYERSLLDTRAGQTYKTYGARRSALVFTVNAHALGAELLIHERSRQGIDGSLKLLFPSSRAITTRADIAYTNDGFVAKADIRNVNDVILTLNADVKRYNDLSARFEMSSPKFNRNPKVLSFVAKQSTIDRPFDIRIEADVSSSQNNALVIESFATYNSYTNNRTARFIVSSRDKKIDFSALAHIALGHTAGVQWSNVNRNGRQSSGYYFAEKDIKNAFNIIINDHYRVRAQISDDLLESTWTVYDTQRNRENGQLRVQFTDTCAQFEVSRDSLSPSSSFRVCLDDNQRHLLVFSTEAKQNANSIANAKLELDTRSTQQTLRFALNWSPQLVARVLEQIADQNDILSPLSSRVIDSEIYREIEHKTQQIANVITRDIIYPLVTVLSDEFEDILQELSQHFPPLVSLIERLSLDYQQLVNLLNEFLYNAGDAIYRFVRQITPTVVSDAVRQWSRIGSRALRNTCIRNSNTCYQYVYAYERYGVEGVVQLTFQKVYESARETHRFAMTTIGQMSKTFAELRNARFLPNFDYILDTRFGQFVSDYARAIFFRVFDSVSDFFERIVEQNEDARQLVNAFNALVRELSREFESIDWSQVRQTLNDAIRTILTPESSTRVLLWDPQNGHVMLEVRAPVIHRRLRAIMTSDNADHASLFDSVQSWLSEHFLSVRDNKQKKMKEKDIKSTKKIYE